MNHKIEIIRTILGIVGQFTSGALFISPVPTLIRIWKSKSTLEFHPYTFLAGVLNCFFWVFYSMPFVHPHSTLITTINSFGLALYLIYLAIFYYYSDTKDPEKAKDRLKVVWGLIVEAIFASGIAAVTLLAFHSTQARSNFAGAVCVVFGIILYGSPLSIMVQVVRTKSVEFLPFWICLAGFCNGIVWAAYAFLPLDFYVLTGNGIGAILASIQLGLHCIYGKRTPAPKSEVELKTTVEADTGTAVV